jgi:hypothetical protein
MPSSIEPAFARLLAIGSFKTITRSGTVPRDEPLKTNCEKS